MAFFLTSSRAIDGFGKELLTGRRLHERSGSAVRKADDVADGQGQQAAEHQHPPLRDPGRIRVQKTSRTRTRTRWKPKKKQQSEPSGQRAGHGVGHGRQSASDGEHDAHRSHGFVIRVAQLFDGQRSGQPTTWYKPCIGFGKKNCRHNDRPANKGHKKKGPKNICWKKVFFLLCCFFLVFHFALIGGPRRPTASSSASTYRSFRDCYWLFTGFYWVF